MKEYLYYSKTDRRLLLLCVGLLFVILVLRLVWPASPSSDQTDRNRDAFAREMAEKDSLKRTRSRKYPVYPKRTYAARSHKAPFTLASLHLHSFDPNQADSASLAAMGLPTYLVRSLVHYREKGGHFSTLESVHRLYGMSDSLFVCLQPYLRLPEEAVALAASPSVTTLTYVPAEKYPAGTVIDLNAADTTELKKIPGIGSGIARAIVGYRERLGGFSEVQQLAEVRFVTPEMQRWFVVEQPVARKIRLNHDKLDRLRAHPYLNYYQACDIIAERNARGDIKSLSRLSNYKEFTEKDFERLKPYLDFE